MANLTRTLAVVLFSLALVLGVFAVMLAREPAPAPEHDRAPAHASSLATPQRLAPVVIAARDLTVGKPLDAESLTVRMQAEPAPGAFGDTAALIGRVPLAAVQKGVPLTADVLSSGLADVVAPGERAVAVRIDETNAVGNFVRPGDYVDVFFTLKRDGGATNGDAEIAATQARLLLSKVRVLSMGEASIGSGAATQKSANPGSPRTAVLAIRTADVDALTLAEHVGRVVLALRNAADSASPDHEAAQAAAGLSLRTLANARPATHAIDKPRSARASANEQIEVIRAGRAERIAY
jgi:pilus assembly protein CpaB